MHSSMFEVLWASPPPLVCNPLQSFTSLLNSIGKIEFIQGSCAFADGLVGYFLREIYLYAASDCTGVTSI